MDEHGAERGGARRHDGGAARRFLARHWRVPAVTVLLMLATALLASLADRGHDPMWQVELPSEVAALGFTPDGDRLLVLQSLNGSFTALGAFTAEGERSWTIPVNASHLKFAAGKGFVAVATAPSPANLTVYDADTAQPFWFAPIPRVFVNALAADGNLLAVALQTTPPAVQIFERAGGAFTLRGEIPFPEGEEGVNQARGIAILGGTVAAGDDLGNVKAWRGGRLLFETRVPLQVLSMDLSAGGSLLLVGGRSIDRGTFTGATYAFDVAAGAGAAPLWVASAPGGVTYLSATAGTGPAIALLDVGPPLIQGWPDATGTAAWSVQANRVINDLLPNGGAALALDPAGQTAAYVTTGDEVILLDAQTGAETWRYRAFGGTALAYHPGGGAIAAGLRLLPDLPPNVVLYFDVDEEPLARDLSRLLPLVLALEALAGLGVLGLRGLSRSG